MLAAEAPGPSAETLRVKEKPPPLMVDVLRAAVAGEGRGAGIATRGSASKSRRIESLVPKLHKAAEHRGCRHMKER